MKLTEYLNQFKEETPQWLKDYKAGDFVDFKTFMSGRIGYYPGSYLDGCLIKNGNQSHSVHTFIHVDYGVKKEFLRNMVEEEGAFAGYHLLGEVEWTERDLMPNGMHPDPKVNYSPRQAPSRLDKDEKPYIFMKVFERDNDKGDDWGAERFAVAFLFADGIATYYQLFVKEYKKVPWLFLLQDHAWGGNWDGFCKGFMLEAIMKQYDMYPQYVICAKSTDLWDGFEGVDGVEHVWGGMHHSERYLCQPCAKK